MNKLYKSLNSILSSRTKAPNFYMTIIFAYILTALSFVIDGPIAFSRWDIICDQSMIQSIGGAVGTTMALDVSAAIAGTVMAATKRRQVTGAFRNIVLVCCGLSFLLSFGLNMALGISMKEQLFDADALSLMENGETTLMIAAVFQGLLPLFTSLISLAVTLSTANSLRTDLKASVSRWLKMKDQWLECRKKTDEVQSYEAQLEEVMKREEDTFENLCSLAADYANCHLQLGRLRGMDGQETEAVAALMEEAAAVRNKLLKLIEETKEDICPPELSGEAADSNSRRENYVNHEDHINHEKYPAAV